MKQKKHKEKKKEKKRQKKNKKKKHKKQKEQQKKQNNSVHGKPQIASSQTLATVSVCPQAPGGLFDC